MKAIKVGIMPADKFQQRIIDIAAGRYKPSTNEPKIWFNSLKSLAEVLNENNTRLLNIIEKMNPLSVKELSELSDRKASNLSRTLKTLERYGIVELKRENKTVRPIVKANSFHIEYNCA
ncbi:MAG: hypothetical protein QG673_1072 [Pseudomonadota bacterium]|jgi:predicted transcriptional regulator|nr:hypothetical protein [Pseudomonadota bacterium]